MEDVRPLLEFQGQSSVNPMGSWKATNNLTYAIEIEAVMANGTRVIAMVPIGASVLLIPATLEDANMIARRVVEETTLRLV